VPAVTYLHGLGFEGWQDHPEAPAVLRLYRGIRRSLLVGFAAASGLRATVAPPISRCTIMLWRTGSLVAFVNPAAVKRVDLALQIAGFCPRIPFALVLGCT